MILFCDTETFSETPISHGVHAYCEGNAEVMIFTWAEDDGPVHAFDATTGADLPDDLVLALVMADTIVFHGSGFDRTVLRLLKHRIAGRRVPIVIEPERIHDTMVQALSHGLPGALGKLSDIFSLPVDKAKDKAGKQLIQLFCKPRPKNSALRRATRLTHPVEWARFLEYAKLDIEAMRVLYKKMPRWNYPTREHDLWCLDQRMNDRGFAVDLDLARAAIDTVNRAKKGMDAATGDLTYGEVHSTTQRDKLLKHLLEEWGVALPDMQAGTLERRVSDENLPWPVRELIAIRLQVSTTSTAKYAALLRSVSSDGRLRGTQQFSGAARTKRWAGRLWQPTNLPRPDMDNDDILLGIDAMKAGSVHLFYDEPMKLASNAIRGEIIAAEGKKLVVSDLEQVEARVLPWLAGEQWKLDAFAAYDRGEGLDLYSSTATRILGRTITKKDPERQSHGKVVELACGYGGSVGAFLQFARLYGVDLPPDEIYDIVRAWREAHPALCDWDTGLWKKLDDAARLAIENPGRVFGAGEHIAFERWRNWLKMHLPSGGFLSYADPRIIPDEKFGDTTVSYMGVNNYTKRWERITTYGGKLSADATQSTAREILAYNLPSIEEAGFPPVLLVHDETVTEPLDDPSFSVYKLNGLLSRCPPWAKGLPLAAGGFETYRYYKES